MLPPVSESVVQVTSGQPNKGIISRERERLSG